LPGKRIKKDKVNCFAFAKHDGISETLRNVEIIYISQGFRITGVFNESIIHSFGFFIFFMQDNKT